VTDKDFETGQPELRLALDWRELGWHILSDQAVAQPECCAWPAVHGGPVGLLIPRGDLAATAPALPSLRLPGTDSNHRRSVEGADVVARGRR
jgi:hypothetical protein